MKYNKPGVNKLGIITQKPWFSFFEFCCFLFLSIIFIFCLNFLSFAFATQELKGERISIVYDDPALDAFAKKVVLEASKALDVVTEILNFKARHITLVIEDTTDSYNAFAITNPHLKVSLRPLFPTESELGFRTENELYSLMLHELMHTAQLTYTATEEHDEILVASERNIFSAGRVASVPPAWFVEGIATWIESTYGGGGRLNDALTNGILQSLALEDALPSLEDVSLTSFSQWPYGRARYLFGVSFIEYLVNKYGFQVIIDTLQVYNRGGLIGGVLNDFSSAWFEVTGVVLDEEWANWQQSLKTQVIQRVSDKAKTISETMSSYASASLSPDGRYLAWVDGAIGIKLAEVSYVNSGSNKTVVEAELELLETKVALVGKAPRKIDWYSNDELVYSRTVRDNLTSFQKLFLLNVTTGEERVFSAQSRLKLATANLATSCIFTIRDLRPEPSLLVELCPVEQVRDVEEVIVKSIWQAPQNVHFLNIAISPAGEILLSVWQEGKADLARFDDSTNTLDFLMHDAGQDLQPSWRIKESGETSIVFRSDRHMKGADNVVFDVYELEPRRHTQQKHRVKRLGRSVGGAFQPISYDDDTIIYSALGSSGFQIATLNANFPNRISYVKSPELSYVLDKVTSFEGSIDSQNILDEIEGFELTNYQPLASMLPYTVSPAISVANVNLNNLADVQYFLAGSILAEDITGKHSYNISAGLNNLLSGHLDGQHLSVNYTYSPTNVLTPISQSPIDMGLSVGVWPHFPFGESATETALGVRAFLNLKLPNDNNVHYANLNVGLVNLQSRSDDWFIDADARLMVSKQRRDTWDYVIDGYRSALFASISPTDGSNETDGALSSGVWATTSYHENVSKLGLADFGVSGIGEAYLQVGYKAAQPIPVSVNSDFSVLSHVGLRHTITTAWRYGDGLHAIERVSFEPRLRTWYDTDLHVGADIGLYADTVINYLAPLSVGVQVGYADGFWYSWGIRLPRF